jgi:hypothetical protein
LKSNFFMNGAKKLHCIEITVTGKNTSSKDCYLA